MQQKPCRLVETRYVHMRIHVAGEVVLRRQDRAFERMDPFRHVSVSLSAHRAIIWVRHNFIFG